jgi:hypothetical protein
VASKSVPTFDEHLLKIVDSFLQTVVVVDDRAFGDPAPITSEAPAEPSVGGRGVQSGLAQPATADEHDLDPKRVTDAFARAGLVCALLAPAAEEEISDEFLRAARRADLVVVDWIINRDGGRTALQLIKKLLESDSAPERQRLRTIAIYTGQDDLYDIGRQVRSVVDTAYSDCKLVEDDGGLSLTKGPLRTTVFAKEAARELPPELADRRVAFGDLPGRVRSEFATLTRGLVSAVALASLAALREDTHRILQVLSPDLDSAYVGHRSVLPVPQDAQEQAVALVASELRSVIEDHDVGQHVSVENVKAWLAHHRPGATTFGELFDATKVMSLAQVHAMLSRGLGTDDALDHVQGLGGQGGVSKTILRNVKKSPTKLFVDSIEDARSSEAVFANRMAVRTTYSRPERILQLGTIVRRTPKKYLLCVQPLCDSVRLSKVRSFPFLTLTPTEDDRATFIVPGEAPGTWVRLVLASSPFDLVTAKFKPRRRGGVVAAAEFGSGFAFTDTSGSRYVWAGQLKPEFAQKVAVDLAQEFARVAVDDAEMFRLRR